MKLLRPRILNPRSQLRHQVLLRIKNIPDPRRKRIRKPPLLEYIQVRPQLKIIGGILPMHPPQRRLPIIQPQAENIPLAPDLKGKIGFLGKGPDIIGDAGSQRNIGLPQTTAGDQA